MSKYLLTLTYSFIHRTSGVNRVELVNYKLLIYHQQWHWTEIAIDQFNFIIRTTQIDPVQMSDYANEIVNTLESAPLSVHELRQKLFNAGFHANFDVVTNEDAGFMEVTIRHL